MATVEQYPNVRPTRRVITPAEEADVSRRRLGDLVDGLTAILEHSRKKGRGRAASLALLTAMIAAHSAPTRRVDAAKPSSYQSSAVFLPFTGQNADIHALPTPITAPMSTATPVPPTPTDLPPPTPTEEPSPEPTRNPELELPSSTLIAYNSSRDVLAKPRSFNSLGVSPRGIADGPGTGWILDSYGDGVAFRFLHPEGGYFEVATDDLGALTENLPDLGHVYEGPRNDIEETLVAPGTRFLPQRSGQQPPVAEGAQAANPDTSGRKRSVTAEIVTNLPPYGPLTITAPLVDRIESPEGAPVTFHINMSHANEMFFHLGYWQNHESKDANTIGVLAFGQQVFIRQGDEYSRVDVTIPARRLRATVTLSPQRDFATWIFVDANGEEAEHVQILRNPMNQNFNLATMLVYSEGATGAEGDISASFPPDANRFSKASQNDQQGQDLRRVKELLEEEGSLRNVHPNVSLPLSGYYISGTTGIPNLTPRHLELVREHGHRAYIDPSAVAGSWGVDYAPGTDGIYTSVTQFSTIRPFRDGQLQRLSAEIPLSLVMKLQLSKTGASHPIPKEARGADILKFIIAYHEDSELSSNISTDVDGFFDSTGLFSAALRRIHRDPQAVLDQIAAGMGHEWRATPLLDRGFVANQQSIDEVERVLDSIQGAPIVFEEIVASAVAPSNVSTSAYYDGLQQLRDALAARNIGLGIRDVGCGVMTPEEAMALTRGVAGRPARLMLCWPGDALFAGKDQNALLRVVTPQDDPARAFRFRLTPQLSQALGGL